MINVFKQEKGVALLIPILVLSFLIIGVTGYYVFRKNSSRTRSSTAEEVALKDALPADISNLLSVDRIKELVATDNASNSLASIELDLENDKLVYHVNLSNGSVLTFDALTGEKLTSIEKTETHEQTLPITFATLVEFTKAREVALNEKPDGKIRKIELETEEGIVVYSVRFTDGARVDVNAETGEVVRSKPAKTESTTNTNSSSSSTSTSNETSGATNNSGSGNSSSGSNNSGSGSSGSSSNSNSGSSNSSSDDDDDDESDDAEDDDDDNSGSNSGSGSGGR